MLQIKNALKNLKMVFYIWGLNWKGLLQKKHFNILGICSDKYGKIKELAWKKYFESTYLCKQIFSIKLNNNKQRYN